MQSIHFHVSREDEQYVAEGREAAIVTQAYTLDDLMHNISEAVELHFEDEPERSPTIYVDLNLTELTHA